MGGRSPALATAQVARTRFASRASGRVGRGGSRAASRRSHSGRRFALVVLSVIVLVLLALVLIDGSSNHHAAPASARPATTPVPVPAVSDTSAMPPPPTATTPAASAPAPTATTTHKPAAPAHAQAEGQARRPQGQAGQPQLDQPQLDHRVLVHQRCRLPAVHHLGCAGARLSEPCNPLQPAAAGEAIVERRRLAVRRDRQVAQPPPGQAPQALTPGQRTSDQLRAAPNPCMRSRISGGFSMIWEKRTTVTVSSIETLRP
jgi:hypothetical protein